MAKALSRKVTIYINGKEVESTIKSLTSEMDKLKKQQRGMIIGSEEYVKTSLKIKEIDGVLKAQKAAIQSVGESWEDTRKAVADYSTILYGLKVATGKIAGAYNWAKGYVEEAARMDDAYADVMKTTGLTHEQVEKLNESFKKMDTRTAREQLNQLAYEAGKLGINTEEGVAQFVSASDKINIALGDVLGDGAMVTIGKLADVYAKSTKQLTEAGDDLEKKMLAIGSAVNMLGQSSTANEHYLVEFLSRMGGIATQANLSADAILGFASALDQDMMKQEMSATAFQKFIMQMIKKPAEFAKAARMEVNQFTELMQRDMNEALLKVLEGFQGQGGLISLQPIFEDLGLDAARAASVISSMANSIDQIREAQAIANNELTTGSSVIKEFNTKNETMQAQAEKAKKRFEEVRIELGNELYPVLIHLQRTGTVLMKGFAGWVQLCKENKVVLIGLIAVLGTWQRARLLSIALRAKEWALGVKNNWLLSQEEKLRRKNAAAAAKETLATEQARLAKIKENIALNEAIVARKKEYAAIGAENVVMAAERNLRSLNVELEKQQAVVTNATTKAMEAKAAAARKIPWTMIVMALVSIIAKLNELRKKSENFKIGETTKEASAQLHQATLKIDALFRAVNKAKKGSDEYKTAINNLKKAYPGLIEKELDHEGNLKNIKKAYDNIKAAAKDSIYTEVKMRRLQEAMTEAGNKVADAEERAIKRFRRGYSGIVPDAWLEEKVDIISEAFAKLDGTMGSYKKALAYIENHGAWTASVHNNLIDAHNAMVEYYKMEQRVNKTLKTIKDVTADIHTETENLNDDPIVPTNNNNDSAEQDEKEMKKRVKAMQKALEDVEKLTNSFSLKVESGLQKVVDDVESKLDQMRERLIEAAKDMGYVKEELDGSLTFTGTDDGKTYMALEKLENAAARLKATNIDAYITKLKDAYWKLAESMGDTDAAGRLMAESDKLQDAIANIDKAIEQAEADAKVATGEHRKELVRLIAYYRELKAEIGGELYRRIQEVQSSFEVVENQVWDPDKEEWVIVPTIKVDKTKMEKQTKDAAEGIKKLIEGIEIEPTAFQKWCNKNLDVVEDFADKALSIFSNINTILNNISDQRIKDLEDEKDANIKTLDEQLEQGLISQETYDQKKQDIENEYNEKANEEKKKQWQRDKAFSLSEATIAAALAAVKVWAAEGTTAYKVAMSALLAAELATQIAAIASQPEPYAKGGYVPRRTVYQAGEAGPEWVASNRLLKDPQTAPMISALEAYQRGNRRALADIPMEQINMPVATRAAQELGRRRSVAESSIASAVSSATPNVSVTMPDNEEAVRIWRELAEYLKDPNNRRAVISRQTMTDFETNENFLRNKARI